MLSSRSNKDHTPPLSVSASSSTQSWRPTRRHWLVLACFLGGIGAFGYAIHPMLAVTARVDADVLVVEGWVADEILVGAAQEFRHGHYATLLTSGLQFADKKEGVDTGSFAAQAADKLVSYGVQRSVILACPTSFVDWNRTSNSARAVRETLRLRGIYPKGINVATAGPHARETWIAYRHIMGHDTAIGVISIPNGTYNASRWWTSRAGRYWVFKNIVGWTKEVLIGQRS